MTYRFFFSYARETYKASKLGSENLLDRFFDDLINQVALLTGERIDEVAYRDTDRLRLSDAWGEKLIDGMQESAVLVCVLSPHYVKSLACGREIGLFQERFARLGGQPGSNTQRVIPVFWMAQPDCQTSMHLHVKNFLEKFQLTQADLPSEYPRIGVSHFYGLDDKTSYFKMAHVLASRIKQLSELPALPKLPTTTDFNGLPSFFAPREIGASEDVAKGPLGTNIVYAVATRDLFGPASAAIYGEKPEDWKPFADKPNRSIGLLTQNALSDAGQDATQYRVIALSQGIVPKIQQARDENSPFIIVLDQASLRLEPIKRQIAHYDSHDAPHVGLVTAGGAPVDEALLRQVFAAKFVGRRPNHLWTVPPRSEDYEQSVADVVSALQTNLQNLSSSIVAVEPSTLPTLTQPGA